MVKKGDVIQRPNTARRLMWPTRETWFQRSRRGVLEPEHQYMGLETYVQDVASLDLTNRCRPTAARMVPHVLM